MLPSGGLNNESSTNIQSASFTQTIVDLQSQKSAEVETIEISSPTLDQIEEVGTIQDVVINRCFIVIAGASDANQAEKLLGKVRLSDFPDADIVKTNGRYRIYSHAFPRRVEAEAFLLKFRAENPKYNTAWVHIKQ